MIQFLGNCLKVVIGCMERFIRFLGHIAYIVSMIFIRFSLKIHDFAPFWAESGLHFRLILERFLGDFGRLLTQETAIYGTNFCRSVVKAFIRLVKNSMNV